MVDATASAVVAAISGIALLVFINALRKTIARSEWDSASVLGALSVALFSSVYVIVTYSGTWKMVVEQSYEDQLKPQWARYLIMLLAGSLALVSAAVFLRALRRGNFLGTINPAAVLLSALVAISAVSAVLNGDNPVRSQSALLLAVLVACTVAPRGLGVHVGIGTFCVIAAVASGLAIAFQKDFSMAFCYPGECGVLGVNFRGVFHHENALAIFLTLALPFVYIGFASWEGTVLSAYLLGLILISGSRTGLVAAVVTFVAIVLVRPNIRRPTRAPVRTVLLYSALAVISAVGFVLPYTVGDRLFLNGRGNLWILVRDGLSDPATFVYGTGMLAWQHVRDSGLIHPSAGYSVHNQWLHVLYTTGLIGLLLFVAALAVLIWQAGRTYSLVIGCVLLPVFILGVAERPWPIDTADWLFWVVPGALLSYTVVKGSPNHQATDAAQITGESIPPTEAERQRGGRHRRRR
jgi:hypothetical protein